MSAKVAFIGLGVMGYPMAGHLVKAGYDVTVYNRTDVKALAWCREFASGCSKSTPALAVKDADIVFTCVGNDEDLRQVTIGAEGAFHGMKAGSIFVDHTTVSYGVTKELAAIAKEKDIGFVDAPVSGGQAGAENGCLTVMAGGDEIHFQVVEKIMSVYAQRVRCLGGVGKGQLTKMVNQICIAGVIQGLSEGLHFAEKAGLDIESVVDVISKGAAQSWQMENRYKTMSDGHYEHGFAVDWMRKDLGICLQEAKNNGASLPMTAIVDQFYAQVQKKGGNRWDTSSLLSLLHDEE